MLTNWVAQEAALPTRSPDKSFAIRTVADTIQLWKAFWHRAVGVGWRCGSSIGFTICIPELNFLLLLLLITRPLPRDEGMAEDYGAPEAGKLPRVWIKGRRETESRQRVSSAKSPLLDSAEWDERCPGAGVRRRCRKDSRFCQSWRDKNLTEGCVRCSVDEREHSKHDEGAPVPRWKSREPVCQRISMRQYASSPRKD